MADYYTLLQVVITLGIAIVAFGNGANDVSKTVATLVGSKRCSARTGILVGAVFNSIGCILAIFIAGKVLHLFASSIVNPIPTDPSFSIAIVYAVISWIILSTLIGMPVSTTHSIIGALVITALFLSPSAIKWTSIYRSALIPLIISPIISFLISFAISKKMTFSVKNPSDDHRCLAKIHWLSAIASSSTRGINDAPKIAGSLEVLTTFNVFSSQWLLVTIALAMGLGGIYAGYRVTRYTGI